MALFSRRYAQFIKDHTSSGKELPLIITIVGGSQLGYVRVLDWIEKSWEAGMVQPFQDEKQASFFCNIRVDEAAQAIGVISLSRLLNPRIYRKLEGVVSPEDIRRIYEAYPEGHQWRKAVVESTSKAYLDGKIQDMKSFEDLRKTVKDFKWEVHCQIGLMKSHQPLPKRFRD